VFAVNIKGAITASQEAAKRLGQGGRIVNISSSTTLFPMVGSSLYAGSKTILKLFDYRLGQGIGTAWRDA